MLDWLKKEFILDCTMFAMMICLSVIAIYLFVCSLENLHIKVFGIEIFKPCWMTHPWSHCCRFVGHAETSPWLCILYLNKTELFLSLLVVLMVLLFSTVWLSIGPIMTAFAHWYGVWRQICLYIVANCINVGFVAWLWGPVLYCLNRPVLCWPDPVLFEPVQAPRL